ncbi:MAG: glycosyltransferase [Pseudomonadota bacterium]
MSSSSYHIDHIENGVLFGWFYDAARPDEAAGFLIEVNGRVAARGIADRYRQDLEDTGMGNGWHAFQCPIPWTYISTSLNIRLLDVDGVPATGGEFVVVVPESNPVLHYQRCDGLNLYFDVWSECDLGEARFNLFCGGERLPQLYAPVAAGAGVLTFPVPDVLRSRAGHFVTLGLAEEVAPLWSGALSLPDRQGSYVAVPDASAADLRNAALQSRLATTSDYTSVQNLLLAHAILSRGGPILNAPPLRLPESTNPEVSIALVAAEDTAAVWITLASLVLAPVNRSFAVTLFTAQPDSFEPAPANLQIASLTGSPAEALNQWAESATGSSLVFLDCGYEVTAGWLESLIEPLAKGNCGATFAQVQRRVVGDPGITSPSSRSLAQQALRRSDSAVEGAFATRRSTFKRVGGLPLAEKTLLQAIATLCSALQANKLAVFTQPFSRLFQLKREAAPARPFANVLVNADFPEPRRVLVIDHTTPDASRDAGSYAALQEMKLMQALGFDITFLPIDLAYDATLTTALQRNGIEVQYAPWCQGIGGFLRERLNDFAAVYIIRFGVAELVIDDIKRFAPALPILFNNADLHFLRELRGAISNGATPEALAGALATRERELAVCRKVDAVLCYNQLEHLVIESHLMQAQNYQLTPWVLEEKAPGGDWSEREGLLFLGNFHHTPNLQGLMFLVQEVMPLLAAQRPDIHLFVYGSNMPAQLWDLATDNVTICGFAENLDTVFHHHRVFVAPLLSGAGIKGKVLEAMAYGLPAVVTDIAAEGTSLTDQVSALIANAPAEWPEAIKDLYDNAPLWRRIAENQRAIAAEQYSFENGLECFRGIFESVGIVTRVEAALGDVVEAGKELTGVLPQMESNR